MIGIQAVYYFLTGIWPLLHIGNFMAFTGEKTDIWLVHMAGLLTVSISICLYFDRRNILLAICSASRLAVIELVYVPKM